MKNIGRNILYLIFGTIIIVWIGFMVPQEFGFIDETQEDQPVAYIAFWANLITGKGATREAAGLEFVHGGRPVKRHRCLQQLRFGVLRDVHGGGHRMSHGCGLDNRGRGQW